MGTLNIRCRIIMGTIILTTTHLSYGTLRKNSSGNYSYCRNRSAAPYPWQLCTTPRTREPQNYRGFELGFLDDREVCVQVFLFPPPPPGPAPSPLKPQMSEPPNYPPSTSISCPPSRHSLPALCQSTKGAAWELRRSLGFSSLGLWFIAQTFS